MFRAAAQGLIAHAFPILIAQLASIGMMVVDTVVLGHFNSVDLAAVAIGGGIQISVVFALVGVLQAVAPVVAHLHGARRDDEVANVLQQGFWLAVLLALPGVLFLRHPDAVLGISTMDAAVEAKVRQYLGLLAWSLPASLFYRTFYAFCNALGKPRVLMGIGLFSLGLHAVLAWGLALQGWLGEPLGVAGQFGREQGDGDIAGLDGGEEADHVVDALGRQDRDAVTGLGDLLQPRTHGAQLDPQLMPGQLDGAAGRIVFVVQVAVGRRVAELRDVVVQERGDRHIGREDDVPGGIQVVLEFQSGPRPSGGIRSAIHK